MHNNHEMLPSLTVQHTLYNIEVMYLQNRRTNLNISFVGRRGAPSFDFPL